MKHGKHKPMKSKNMPDMSGITKKMQPASDAEMKAMMKKMECNMDMGKD